jgi:hypothetical protein
MPCKGNRSTSASQAHDCTLDEAKAAVRSIANRFGLHMAKETVARLGYETVPKDAPIWALAELVRFSKIEASTADEFRTALWRESVDFLEELRPGGPWVLTAIVPDGRTETITARTANEAQGFVRTHNGQRNLYYSVNPTRKVMTKKAAKVDIGSIDYVLADLDPAENETAAEAKARYLAQLDALEQRPTAIIDSGNGIQVLWKLKELIVLGEPVVDAKGKLGFSPEDMATIDDVESRVEAVMVGLGAKAGTQNIDRILRLPGTTNLPNAAKKRNGRVPCRTKLLEFNDVAYPLDAFPLPAEKASSRGKTKAKRNKKREPHIDFDNLPKVDIDALPVSDKIKDLIRTGDTDKYGYPSRSEGVFAALCAMIRAGCSDDQMAAVMWHEPYGSTSTIRPSRNCTLNGRSSKHGTR